MDNIKVYKIGDCDWIATKWSLEETLKWYQSFTDIEEYCLEDVEEISLDNLLYDEDGNKYTFESIIIENLEDGSEDLSEPFIIASTEY